MKKAVISEGVIYIYFGGKDFKKGLSIVRMLDDKLFNAKVKQWQAPYSIKNIGILKKNGFFIEDKDNAYKFIDGKKYKKEIKLTNKEFPLAFLEQLEGLEFLYKTEGRGILVHDVGMGKTYIGIKFLELLKKYDNKDAYPILIVTLASVKFHWEDDYLKFIEDKKSIQILSGRNPVPITGDVVIINYDILGSHYEELRRVNFKTLIIDEVQEIKVKPEIIKVENEDTSKTTFKTKKTIKYDVIKRLSVNIPYIIGLSATPIDKCPAEFYNILNIIRPDIFSSRQQFHLRFCDPRYNGFAWVYDGLSNEEELKDLVKNVIHRRIKTRKGLINTPIYVKIDNQKAYDEVKSVKNLETRYTCFLGKRKQILEFINSIVTTEKVCLFAFHKKVIEDLMLYYGDTAIKIDGSVPSEKRKEIIQEFQENPNKKVFIGNNESVGTGTNGLQKASCIGIMVELPWTPTRWEQIMGRLNRTGQTKLVNFYYFIGKETIDEEDLVRIGGYEKIFNTLFNEHLIEE